MLLVMVHIMAEERSWVLSGKVKPGCITTSTYSFFFSMYTARTLQFQEDTLQHAEANGFITETIYCKTTYLSEQQSTKWNSRLFAV